MAGTERGVGGPQMLAAVASALRLELVELLDGREPTSVAELSALLDRPATALYYHLQKLVEAGWLEQVSTGGMRRFRRVAGTGDVVGDPHARESQQHAVRVVEALLRQAGRDFRGAALERPPDPLHRGTAKRMRMRATPEVISELRRRLDAVREFVDEVGLEGEGAPYSFTMVLAPLAAEDDD